MGSWRQLSCLAVPLLERTYLCDEKTRAGAESPRCLLFCANGLTGGLQGRRLAG